MFNFFRINRAGRIAGNKTERSFIEKQSKLSDDEKKQIKKLNIKIAKDEERQKIASENATKRNTKVVNVDKSKNVNTEVSSQVGVINSKRTKSKK